MYKYEVTYWQEGPGRSDYVTVLVAAINQKTAIKFVIDTHGVYSADRSGVSAKKIKGKVEAVDLGYVERT
jgi:hypothetical protein